MPRTVRSTSRRAFTLIELMIVVAIIAVLIAILLPSLARARQQAMQVACAANLNAIFKGMFYYTQDTNNGNGYLPQLLGHPNTVRQIGYWTGQIYPYMKIKRSRLGSRTGLLSCPAHENPQLRWVYGPKAGLSATVREKIFSDTGMGSPLSVGRRGAAAEAARYRHARDLIEPVSYAGPCDSLEYRVMSVGGKAQHSYFPRKWTNIRRPHCFLMLTESLQTDGSTAACFRFEHLIAEARTNPDYKRHFGGRNPMTNGSNFLFADGHVRWHSADFAAGSLICCVDFGVEGLEATANASGAREAQRGICMPQEEATTRRR